MKNWKINRSLEIYFCVALSLIIVVHITSKRIFEEKKFNKVQFVSLNCKKSLLPKTCELMNVVTQMKNKEDPEDIAKFEKKLYYKHSIDAIEGNGVDERLIYAGIQFIRLNKFNGIKKQYLICRIYRPVIMVNEVNDDNGMKVSEIPLSNTEKVSLQEECEKRSSEILHDKSLF